MCILLQFELRQCKYLLHVLSTNIAGKDIFSMRKEEDGEDIWVVTTLCKSFMTLQIFFHVNIVEHSCHLKFCDSATK